ncbi:lectin 9-like [Cicer arietinum]|uniref:Agglutinin-2-like n=1 Tax=Cicer arietinum TaxID=3827 RepID=A0A1S2YZX0_CICAR|nr:agglutinin-2-like [Cicer arietinum]
MAFSNSITFLFITFLFLKYPNVNSQSQVSGLETFTFTINQFKRANPNIVFEGDASVSGGILKLTKTDQLGKPLSKSVGRAIHLTPIHIWDKINGELADFSTTFIFAVNTNGSQLHGDGFTFFLGPIDFDLPKNSSGGYLGLFNPETALIPSENPILAIEFDSFTNEWDPTAPFQSPHIGIDVGSIDSVATTDWPIDFVQRNAIGEASINYNSESKRLSVFVAYPGSGRNVTGVSSIVDLRSVLPEWVRVGFTAATGELVETHDIISWSFESAL